MLPRMLKCPAPVAARWLIPGGGLRWGYNGRSEQVQARVSGLAAAGGAGQGPPWAALARPQPPAAVTAEPRPLSRYLASAEPGQSE